ncbi:MAG: class I SAM-dependent methyltransferase [Solirubrobacteraceae bacterium]
MRLRPARRRPSPPDWASPAFTAADIPDAVWERRSELRGIAFDLDAQAALLAELAPLGAELANTGYPFANRFYEHVDAEVAYAMVRRLRPARVVELGSGFSTRALRAALAANGSGTHEGYDPYTTTDGVQAVSAQDVPEDVFSALVQDDILFVDTTHVVKTGGDVNRIVLDVLPALAAGVVIHFHDIWLPFEYHRALTETLGANWSEQYLLQALLSGNPGFEVLLGNAALARDRREAVQAAFPEWDPAGEYPSAFWLRRTAA